MPFCLNMALIPYSVMHFKVNYKLVQLLVDKGSQVPLDKNEEEKNILHIMAEQCVTTPMSHLLHILAGKVITYVTLCPISA